ncbi:tetratricopeptide repeat protein [Pelagicoccus sp. SDUM812002]|uniref:tetratricopeptide repeat protein n=1 Tax=Pelagicoccus sp. SDUM812002 TaxID=3041266 RepID=UPI00280ED3E5|nr:tetratricopeptide repeat protein [Pelagicoccus sp. SDUM812002]MDQ8185642.1 hypothetical protein [Pelagicoccus sp. SDUM812002]
MPEVSLKELDARVRKQVGNARTAVERGNFEYCVEICSSLLLEHPGCLEVRELLRQAQQSVFTKRGRGFLHRLLSKIEASFIVLYGKPYLKKDAALAMAYGERALTRDPLHEGALSLVAAGAAALEFNETAVFCLKKIYENETKDLVLLQRYCEALIKVGETNQAVAIAERLKRLKPESSLIQELVKSASVAHSINRGKWAEEEQDFRSKLKDEELSEALEKQSRLIQDVQGARVRARELIEEIHEDPQSLDLYKQLVKAYLYADDYREALVWLDKAAMLPQAESDIGLKQLRSEIMIKATELELSKLHSGSGPATEERIQKLEAELDVLKLEESRKMVEQFPNDYAQRLNLGELLLAAGKVDEAIKEFQVAQRGSSLKQRSCVMLGRSFSKKRLYDLALEQFDRSIADAHGMDEFKKDVLYSSAQCCEALGRKEEAARRYKLIYANDISFRDVAGKIDGFYSDPS